MAQHYIKLLEKLLSAWDESTFDVTKANEEKISLWAEKLNSIISSLLNATSYSSWKKAIAKYVFNIGNIFCQLPGLNRRLYIEIAITCYKQALTVYTQEKFPIGWANIQYNLAIAYSDRIAGAYSDNLEQA